jgi:hypothetical protein
MIHDPVIDRSIRISALVIGLLTALLAGTSAYQRTEVSRNPPSTLRAAAQAFAEADAATIGQLVAQSPVSGYNTRVLASRWLDQPGRAAVSEPSLEAWRPEAGRWSSRFLVRTDVALALAVLVGCSALIVTGPSAWLLVVGAFLLHRKLRPVANSVHAEPRG